MTTTLHFSSLSSLGSALYCRHQQEPLTKTTITDLVQKSFDALSTPLPLLILEGAAIATLFIAPSVACAALLPIGIDNAYGLMAATLLIMVAAAPIIAKLNADLQLSEVGEEDLLYNLAEKSTLHASYESDTSSLKLGAEIALVIGVVGQIATYFPATSFITLPCIFLSDPVVAGTCMGFSLSVIALSELLAYLFRGTMSEDEIVLELQVLRSQLKAEREQLEDSCGADGHWSSKILLLTQRIIGVTESLKVFGID